MYAPGRGGGGGGDAAEEAEWQNRGRMDFLLEWATLDSALAATRAAPAPVGCASGEEAIDLVALLPPPPSSPPHVSTPGALPSPLVGSRRWVADIDTPPLAQRSAPSRSTAMAPPTIDRLLAMLVGVTAGATATVKPKSTLLPLPLPLPTTTAPAPAARATAAAPASPQAAALDTPGAAERALAPPASVESVDGTGEEEREEDDEPPAPQELRLTTPKRPKAQRAQRTARAEEAAAVRGAEEEAVPTALTRANPTSSAASAKMALEDDELPAPKAKKKKKKKGAPPPPPSS